MCVGTVGLVAGIELIHHKQEIIIMTAKT